MKKLYLVLVGIFLLFLVLFLIHDYYTQDSSLVSQDQDYYGLAFEDDIYVESDCLKIQDEELRYDCLTEMKLRSVGELAVNSDNVSVCDSLVSEKFIVDCRDNYYLIKASTSGNDSFCDSVLREDLRNECY